MKLQQNWLALSGAMVLCLSLLETVQATETATDQEASDPTSTKQIASRIDAKIDAKVETASELKENERTNPEPVANHIEAETNLGDELTLSAFEYLATERDPDSKKLAQPLPHQVAADPEIHLPQSAVVEAERRQPSTLASLPVTSQTAADLLHPSKQTTKSLAEFPAKLAPVASSASSASPVLFPPRVGVGYNGAGHEGSDSFGRLEGFVPLRQNPGRNLTFLEGRVLLNNEAHLGANVILAHRAYSKKDNRIYGGYFAYDNRNTSHKFFQQLGLGFESLGEVWDIRTNAYIPIGDTRQQIDVSIFDTNLQVTNTRFSGHNLLLDTFRQRSEERRFEAAVFSFDIEGGGRIAKLGSHGDLRLYGGPYYYSAPEGESVVGWRTRLVARPSKYLNLSVGVQMDGLFGTNLLFQIGAAFPSSRGKRAAEEPTLLARMGEFVERNNSIVIDQQQTTSFFQESLSLLARNPATGEPWFFNHVRLGLGSGDGNFESPYGTVAAALATIPTDGNGIVYVAEGRNPGIPAFTIPDTVQVLSRGPVQTIPVQSTVQSQREPIVSTILPNPLQLPFSGSGNFPLVTDTVTMGNDTVLSGFTITPPTGSVGVFSSGVRNVEIRDNRIATTGDDAAGIRLSNPGGTVTISNNQIATTGNTTNTAFNNANFVVDGAHGIEIDLSNASLEGATISGNSITTQGTWAVGILTSARDGGTLAAATISGNTVSTAGLRARGIYFRARSISRSATLTAAILSGNTISTMGDIAHGIYSSARSIGGSASIDSLTISSNTISTLGNNARGIYSMARGDGGSASIDSLTISGNTISTLGTSAHGISSMARSTSGSASIASATTSGNTISTVGNSARGIFARALSFGGSATFTSATITSNTISTAGNLARGIVSFARSDGGSATLASATITGNTASTVGSNAHGIYAYSRKNGAGISASLCTTLASNSATTQQANANGFRFNRIVMGAGTATFQIVDTAGTFPTTQANNTASVPGGGMAFNFVGGTGNFTQVTNCP